MNSILCLTAILYCPILLTQCQQTYQPTFMPTFIPTPIVQLQPQSIPIAEHQLIVVETARNAEIRLKSYSDISDKVLYTILSIPMTGILSQLSKVYSSYGYEPKMGAKIMNSTLPAVVTGSNNRIIYTRPSPDAPSLNMWGNFQFVVTGTNGVISYPGTITLVPPSGAIIGNSFLLNTEGWNITGNKLSPTNANYEPYSRGQLLNRYIIGTDDKINIQGSSAATNYDESLWYFEAPLSYFFNLGIAYGGVLQLNIGAFSGNFNNLNPLKTNVIILECDECQGPVTKGITLGYTMASLFASPNGVFDGSPTTIKIKLIETTVVRGKTGIEPTLPPSGWMKDPQNTLLPWIPASKCDVIQVLSRLSRFRILGDWTTWYETVAVDNIQIINQQGALPLCAMIRPDASICDC